VELGHESMVRGELLELVLDRALHRREGEEANVLMLMMLMAASSE